MNVLRLKLYQQTTCYKKPFAFKVSETYPLPPHSTVKGMLHAILEANSLIPMRISIQGRYETLATDYQTHYFFKKDKTNEFGITLDGLEIEHELSDITTMPIYMHMLFNVELLIHVQADEEILVELEKRINSGSVHLSLGRWEDLVRVDECELVNTDECEEDVPLRYNAFVPEEMLDGEGYFPYRLNWTYRIINGVRVWDKLHVGYVYEGVHLSEYDDVLKDSYGDLIFFP